MDQKEQNLTKIDLAEFTEDVLLPGVERIVDDKVKKEIGAFRHDIKDYIDVKLGETKGDIIAVIKGEKEKDKSFKTKVVEIFKRNKLGDQREIEFLEALIQ